jgi:hypothetical protein
VLYTAADPALFWVFDLSEAPQAAIV